jgi:endo-1,4-beta-xylanase
MFVGSLLAAAEPAAAPTTPAQEKSHPVSVPLWVKGAPGSEARKAEAEKIDWRQEPDIAFPITSNIHNPSVTPYLPVEGKATGAAVVIAPGGGHMFLTTDREGYDVAEWLAQRGIAAFVLKYRLARDRSNSVDQPQPYTIDRDAQADALRAIRVIRSRAAEWGVDPARVGVMGFSAGGEVALLAACHHDVGRAEANDPVERFSSRPSFVGLIYPGGLQRIETGLTFNAEATPPAFLACAYDDRMPEQLAQFFVGLRKAGVNAELHIYNKGGHGFGVRQRPIAVTSWPERFVDWLGDRGFLAKK